MTSLFNCLLSLLLGLALAGYGLAHSLARRPEPAAVATLADSLPAIGSVLLFVLGVVAAAAGVAVVVASARRLRVAWRRVRRSVDPRQSPIGRPHDGYNGNGYHDVDEDQREWAGSYR